MTTTDILKNKTNIYNNAFNPQSIRLKKYFFKLQLWHLKK